MTHSTERDVLGRDLHIILARLNGRKFLGCKLFILLNLERHLMVFVGIIPLFAIDLLIDGILVDIDLCVSSVDFFAFVIPLVATLL